MDWLLHDILPAVRGTDRYDLCLQEDPEVTAPLSARTETVRLAESLYGRDRARALWHSLHLPPVPSVPAPSGQVEARACLHHLVETPFKGAHTIREAIAIAMDGHAETRAMLHLSGILVPEFEDGFVVTQVRDIIGIYKGTRWDRGRFVRVLRRLPGAGTAGATFRYNGRVARGTWIPASALGDDVLT